MSFRYCSIRKLVRIATFLSPIALSLMLLVQPASLCAETPAKPTRKVIVRVDPEYPDFLRNGHFESRVVAEATVLANGNVSSVEIKSGNPMFAEFVTKALMKWKYTPAPAQTVEQATFNFAVIQR